MRKTQRRAITVIATMFFLLRPTCCWPQQKNESAPKEKTTFRGHHLGETLTDFASAEFLHYCEGKLQDAKCINSFQKWFKKIQLSEVPCGLTLTIAQRNELCDPSGPHTFEWQEPTNDAFSIAAEGDTVPSKGNTDPLKWHLTWMAVTIFNDYATVEQQLTDKYGKPTDLLVFQMQNGFGAHWEVGQAYWDFEDASIQLRQGTDFDSHLLVVVFRPLKNVHEAAPPKNPF